MALLHVFPGQAVVPEWGPLKAYDGLISDKDARCCFVIQPDAYAMVLAVMPVRPDLQDATWTDVLLLLPDGRMGWVTAGGLEAL